MLDSESCWIIEKRDKGAVTPGRKSLTHVDLDILIRRSVGGGLDTPLFRETIKETNMNRNTLRGIARLLAPALFLSALAAGQGLTPSDREKVLRYLADTRNGVVEATKGLSDAQWKFKPAPDRWSIAEVIEHIVLVEDYLLENVRPQLASSTASLPERDVKQMDAMILARMPDRSAKFQAPPPIVPTGRWTPQAALDRFLADRKETVAFLKS